MMSNLIDKASLIEHLSLLEESSRKRMEKERSSYEHLRSRLYEEKMCQAQELKRKVQRGVFDVKE